MVPGAIVSRVDDERVLPQAQLVERIQQATGFTILYVTHDQEEALEVSDRVVIMEGGLILTVGTPAEVAGHAFLEAETEAGAEAAQ